MNRTENNPWLHRFAVLTAVATLVLIGVGGLVTSKGAGMAVPDWPTSYGYNMFALPFKFWKGGAFYEHTHRLWASEVGLLTVILNFWLFGNKSRALAFVCGLALIVVGVATAIVSMSWLAVIPFVLHGLVLFGASFCEPSPKWLRRLGIIALVMVVLQGVLGGLRVVLFKDQIGIFHAALAQSFLVLLCAIALFTSKWWQNFEIQNSKFKIQNSAARLFLFTTILIFCQLVLGATMRHQHAGLAIADFPLAYGQLWPDMSAGAVARYNAERMEVMEANAITAAQIGLQMAHRLGAVLILGAVALCAWRAKGFFRKLVFCWLGLILTQAALGAWTIWSNKAADVATAHVVVGALSLVTGALLTIIAFRFSGSARQEPRPTN